MKNAPQADQTTRGEYGINGMNAITLLNEVNPYRPEIPRCALTGSALLDELAGGCPLRAARVFEALERLRDAAWSELVGADRVRGLARLRQLDICAICEPQSLRTQTACEARKLQHGTN